MGIPKGAVRQALQKEGKDPDVATMDPNKSYASQAKPKVEDGPPLKDDPEYVKFFKMLKMMIPEGAVRQAIQKEGKDVSILEMDPNKSYASQKSTQKEVGPPLKDDPEYQVSKILQGEHSLVHLRATIALSISPPVKMLKMGIPLGAVQNALKKEGKDPGIINMDPSKPLGEQQSKSKDTKKPSKPKGPKVARKRLHWNKIDESKLHADSFWNQAKEQDLQLVGLDFDNEEFANLFTSEVGKAAAKKDAPADDKKKSRNQKVQLMMDGVA
ncbi:hypothetical protein THAOC_31592 [Thalassiosira oceanica]|uniref:FH2 domain-containing protein n=1 Tax=Thalassiosira oceanica TaxID=159749 RepID=K0R7S7_THAOC|nr:hypothetical protein THAOC_31592 [Thalassiosira oceanica]|eukprot:EJK49528.1 hypothetical protein THAOC_31592 [Thalassiosira oceanica]